MGLWDDDQLDVENFGGATRRSLQEYFMNVNITGTRRDSFNTLLV